MRPIKVRKLGDDQMVGHIVAFLNDLGTIVAIVVWEGGGINPWSLDQLVSVEDFGERDLTREEEDGLFT